MSTPRSMGAGVSSREVRTQCGSGSQEVNSGRQTEIDLSDIAAKKRQLIEAENLECSQRFAKAVNAWGKQSAYAARIGVTEGVLSEMMSGKRVVQARHLLPLYDNAYTAKIWIDGECEKASLAPVRPHRKTNRRDIAAALLDVVMAMGMWPLLRQPVADRVGVEPADADLGLTDEPIAEAAGK